ncbi:MAG: hypothetical protein IPJ34_43650, partial [Myxococcales bacterium]|nr:hypothetical protein [Myxococcales bacterium]
MSANVRKVTLAITKDEYEWAERTATRTGVSISSVLSAAAREKRTAEERDARQRTAWAEVVDLVLAGSPLTEDELAAAKAELDGLMIPRIEPPSAKSVARERLDALRALGCAVAGDDGVNLPAGGPRGGLSRPISHYGLVFEKPAREALGLSHVEFRALVLPAAWVKNPESVTGPRVGSMTRGLCSRSGGRSIPIEIARAAARLRGPASPGSMRRCGKNTRRSCSAPTMADRSARSGDEDEHRRRSTAALIAIER